MVKTCLAVKPTAARALSLCADGQQLQQLDQQLNHWVSAVLGYRSVGQIAVAQGLMDSVVWHSSHG